jgi:NAD(P)-dependent dehydrogenase (short-subunit alcohol dehydrogenase family)
MSSDHHACVILPAMSATAARRPGAFARYPSLQGRCVLITGGATGIGASLVAHFWAQGARVGFIDLDAAAGAALANRLSAATPRAAAGATDDCSSLPDVPAGATQSPPCFVAADLTDIDALRAAIDAVRARLGPIEVLINNAANDARQGLASVTPASWDAAIAVNLKHQFFAAQAVAPDMVAAGGGAIVNLGSISWLIKVGGLPVYNLCKAAVQGLTRSLARDLGGHGIRVNALLPGAVQTERQLRLWLNPAAVAAIQRAQCLDAPLREAHIAHMALFLAADDSAMCTAQDFIVDAGYA